MQNSILNTHFGLLQEQANLVSRGIDSAQATSIVFSNEDDFSQLREANQKSACCRDEVYYIEQTALCCGCGNICDKY